MSSPKKTSSFDFVNELKKFGGEKNQIRKFFTIGQSSVPVFTNEYWTSKQRQGNSIHEISYRACFKPQLPQFFIERLTTAGDIVYDPFTGRGTTILEAALLNRKIISNDINPLSKILCESRLFVPAMADIESRLNKIVMSKKIKSDLNLSMFFEKKTLNEILNLKNYLQEKKIKKKEDEIDKWIRMVATNRLTGHSTGFFSVYTLPPNQAVSAANQEKINTKRNQAPEYRDVKKIILKKSQQLMRDLTEEKISILKSVGKSSLFLATDARKTTLIKNNSVQLTVTSPPFLDVVQYADDNWLRCWFNGIDANEIGKNISMAKKIEDWNAIMLDVFHELFRITKKGGFVAFEVGEVRHGKIKLEEHVVVLGSAAGFSSDAIMINEQQFTKTSNIWGVSNNSKGTNTNRIVIFRK